jgi:AcrR family transcriptional regulator
LTYGLGVREQRVTGTRQRRRRTKQGTVLSEDLIVATALRLLREHGEQAITVRRLGAALGADPSALYRYFRNTDALLLAVADELIGQTMHGLRRSGDWRADLREIGRRIHATYQQHPQAAKLANYRVTGRRHEIAGVETVLSILTEAGFPGRDAVRYYHAFVDQALAFAALDSAVATLPADIIASDCGAWREIYARLPARDYPNVAALADLLVDDMPHSSYPLALELLLDSIGHAISVSANTLVANRSRTASRPGAPLS